MFNGIWAMLFNPPTQGNDALQTFIQQNYDTQLLIVIGMALLLGLQFIRSFNSRDKTLNTVVTQLSLVISQQGKTLDERDQEYGTLFKEISERNAKADQLHTRQIAILETISMQNQESLKTIEHIQTENIEVLTEHDKWAQGSVKDIMEALSRVEVKVDAALKTVAEIKAFFPVERSDVLARLEQQLAETIEQLKDCGKIATDENPIVTIPIEHEPETLTKQEPGTAGNVAA